MFDKYQKSQYLLDEATNSEGALIADLWQAVVRREQAVDEITNGSGSMSMYTAEEVGYYEKARTVRNLQELYGVQVGSLALDGYN